MVDKSDLLLLSGKAILFCGMRMCFALTFCGGISFCCLKRQRKENGLPTATGKTSVISHHLCPVQYVLALLPPLAPCPQLAALQSWKQGPSELCPFPGSGAAGWDLESSQAHPPEPICPGQTSPSGTAALKWPRTEKRTSNVILTPDQTQPPCPMTSNLTLELLASSP